jgi:membrane protease YdiL (CAAX protease family)
LIALVYLAPVVYPVVAGHRPHPLGFRWAGRHAALLVLMLAPVVIRTVGSWSSISTYLGTVGRTTAGLLAAKALYQPGFWEELYFRAFLYAAIRTRVGVAPAAALSALLFVVMHVEVVAWTLQGGEHGAMILVGIFLLGVAMATKYERSRSILPCMLYHGVTVGLAFALRALGA